MVVTVNRSHDGNLGRYGSPIYGDSGAGEVNHLRPEFRNYPGNIESGSLPGGDRGPRQIRHLEMGDGGVCGRAMVRTP